MPPVSINHERQKYLYTAFVTHPSLWIIQRGMGTLPSSWSNILLSCSDIYHSQSFWHFLSLPKKVPNILLGRSPVFLKLTKKRLIFSHWPACAESHQKVLALRSSSNLGIGDFGFALRNQVLIHDSTQGVGVSQQSGLGAIECTGYSGHHYWSAQICSDLWEEHCL